jgi:hypothetical protein
MSSNNYARLDAFIAVICRIPKHKSAGRLETALIESITIEDMSWTTAYPAVSRAIK